MSANAPLHLRQPVTKAPQKAHVSHELRQLARDVRRIHDPLRASPEAVYAAKDAIAARLIHLANQMEAGR